MRVVNKAHPEFFMAGAFGAYLTITHVTRHVLGVLVGGMAVALVVGVVVERLAIRPVRGRYVMIPFIATSGAGIALQHGAERLFGSDPVLVPPVVPSVSYTLGPLSVTRMQLVTLGIAAVLMLALRYYVRNTKWGRATRAVAERPDVAAAFGVDVNFVSQLTFWTPVLITAGINSIIALGLYITMSSGPLSVAHAALAGMGGYLSAVLTTNFGWPFPVAIAAGMALAFLTGFVLGLLIVRMNELVAGLTTLGFGETMAVIAFNIDYIGGANAFTGIPMRTSLPLVYAALAVVLWASWRYDHSRLGFAARATRDSPVTAAAMGIDIVWVKSFTFGVGAAIAALGGVLRAHYILVQGPEDMGFFVSVGFLIFVVFGGSYTFWRPLFGGMALTILPELLRFSAKDRFIIYGILLTVMVIIRPQGLITRVPTGAAPRWFGGRRRAPTSV